MGRALEPAPIQPLLDALASLLGTMKTMLHAVVGNTSSLGMVAVKAALLFLTAVLAFRLSARRTLAEMGAYDFVAAIAAGAIIGRVPNSTTTSYLQGAVTLLTILVAHAVLTRLRYAGQFSGIVDHPPRLLISHGSVVEEELRRAGFTRSDLYAVLRQHDVHALDEVEFAVLEARGRVSVIRRRPQGEPASSEVLAVARKRSREVAGA